MTEIPEELASELKSIIRAEIAAGNSISQVDTTWPRRGALCVQLKQRFIIKHRVGSSVQYMEDKDPHGPFAEYVQMHSGQSVLCSLFR